MLPDIRAVMAAVVAAIGLMIISFALVATFRVAQDVRAGVLQADLAQRGRSPAPVDAEPRVISIIAAPEPPAAGPEYAEALEAVPVTPVLAAAPLAEPVPVTPVIVAAPLAEPVPPAPEPAPRAEPPMGGPLPEQIAAVHVEAPPRDLATERAARKKAAQKARAARLARERKTAARRAAQMRARQKAAASSNNVFGEPFGTSFGTNTFEQRN
jgi:hypothetical protein